jgi:thiaminase/transcriptional activator TenA
MTAFSERAWRGTSALYDRILDLPFNRELAAGTLAEERFRFYMIQDALYLTQYARALAAASAKAPDIEAMQFFAKAAATALVVERALHGGFFAKFGIDPADAAAAEPSPTCYGYTNFLLATALQDNYASLTAAVLPCFWIYWEVGKHIAAVARPENPYRAWIDTYSDPGFGEAVTTAIAVADRAAVHASEEDRRVMLDKFRRSVQYEWMFWDSAYRREAWLVAV